MQREIAIRGKLMVAGEYTVLEPGGLALALAVPTDLRVRASRIMGPKDLVDSEALGLQGARLASDPRLRFAAESLGAVREALAIATPAAEVGGIPSRFHVRIAGTMRAAGGVKVGLGSSAAVCCGVVAAAWMAATGQPIESQTWFRLAHLAHGRAQGKVGSGYDVATIIMGAPALAYTAPDAGRMSGAGADTTPDRPASLSAYLAGPWPECRLEPLALPASLYVVAVFSGQSADTRRLVGRTVAARELDAFAALRHRAHALVESWRRGAVPGILTALDQAERAFWEWDDAAASGLVPAHIRALHAELRALGGHTRTSGAGGGDCLLVFSDDPACAERALRWAADRRLVAFGVSQMA